MCPRVETLDHGLGIYLVSEDTARLLPQRLFASTGSSPPELQLLSGVLGQHRVVTIQRQGRQQDQVEKRDCITVVIFVIAPTFGHPGAREKKDN
jgi:hypothetical protein